MEQETNVLQEFAEPTYEYASAGQRFLNYLIDFIAFYLLVSIVGIFIGLYYASSGEVVNENGGGFIALTYAISFAIFLAYYTLLEGTKGKTLGKLITKTKVVREDGEPMNLRLLVVFPELRCGTTAGQIP
jgi:uncharacterized RDD family membrane protein YckC